jgi:hypothetical protein
MAEKKKKILPQSLIVTQSNQLVQARYNLPLGEQRLVLTMISKIQPDDEDFKPYRISVSELAEFLGIDRGSAYRECKKITENLLKRVLSIEESDGLLQTNWVSSAKYIDGTGVVNLTFDPSLKPYLLQLKSNFTSCKLEMLLSFKSQYSVRIYTLLKQYEKLKEREIELEELRGVLGIRKDLHIEYRDFKRHILQATQKELTEKSDLYFDFEEVKYGRRVGAIRFRIFIRTLPKLLASEQTLLFEERPNTSSTFTAINVQNSLLSDELLLLVHEEHRAKKTVLSSIMEFKKKHGVDYVKRNILYSNAKAGKSYAGFLVNALKQDWAHDWHIEQQQAVQSPPVNKKALEVWERQGFKSQKEYDVFMYERQMQDYKRVRNPATR